MAALAPRFRVVGASDAFERACRVCGERKPATEFPVMVGNVPPRSGRCRSCLAEYKAERYAAAAGLRSKNAAGVVCECGCGEVTRVAPHSDPAKGWVKGLPLRYVVGHSGRGPRLTDAPTLRRCVDCLEYKEPSEFHLKGRDRKKLMTRCKRCDNALRSERALRQRDANIKAVWEAVGGARCAVCGEDDPIVIHFHHLDPTQKTANVSKLLRYHVPLDRILEEVSKCAMLCANCHLRVHAGTACLPAAGV